MKAKHIWIVLLIWGSMIFTIIGLSGCGEIKAPNEPVEEIDPEPKPDCDPSKPPSHPNGCKGAS